MNILSYFGLARDQRRNALLLIGTNFFEGLSIALFYSVALTYFLDHNPISAYGWLMVASGAFVIFFTLIYQKIEHVLELGKLFMFLAITTVSVFILGYGMTSNGLGLTAASVGFMLMVLHHFIYVLYKIRFWGLTAMFYDVRQSKRVFGLIGSMNLPAKFIGFTLVTTLNILTDVGYENLLMTGIATYLCSAGFMYVIIRKNPKVLQLEHSHKKHQGHHAKSIVKGVFMLAMVMMFTMSFITFLFAKEVQHHFELSDGNMFRLISEALAVSYGLATLVKIVVSGKVLSRFKLRSLLLITPLLLALAIIIHLFVRTTMQIQEQEYLFFVMLMMGSLILTEAIDNPLVMSLFQPLSKREILGGHTLVKGFGESIALIVLGLTLVFFYRGHNHIDLALAIPIVLFSSLVWLFFSGRFSKSYLHNLRHLIELKLITGNRVMFFNKDTDAFLRTELFSDDVQKVTDALEILVENRKLNEDDIKRLLNTNNEEIQNMAYTAMERFKRLTPEMVVTLHERLKVAKATERDQILTVLATKYTGATLDELLRLGDADSHFSIAKGLAQNKKFESQTWMQKQITSWMLSGDMVQAEGALSLMSSFIHPTNVMHLERALNGPSHLVQLAIKMSTHYLEQMVDALLPHLDNRSLYRDVLKAFASAPSEVIHGLKDKLKDKPEQWVDLLLINEHPTCTATLLSLLREDNPDVRRAVLLGLQKRKGAVLPKAELIQYLKQENELLQYLTFSVVDNKLLNNALILERNEVVERMLGYCYLHSHERVLLNAQKELFLNGENKMALCIEALQASLPLSIFKPIRMVLEARDEPEKDEKGALRKHLYDHRRQLSRWMNLMLLDEWREIKSDTLEKMKENKVQRIDRVLMLRKTALFEEIRDNRLLDIADLMEEVSVEKDAFIFNKGDGGDSLFIITHGEVAIIDDGHELVRFKRGDFFGDLSLLDPAPRSAAAKATQDTTLLSLDQSAIYEMMYDHIEVVQGIVGSLCKRIRNQNKVYIEEKNKVSEQI